MRRAIVAIAVLALAATLAAPTSAKPSTGPPRVMYIHGTPSTPEPGIRVLGIHVRVTGVNSSYQVQETVVFEDASGAVVGEPIRTPARLWQGAGTGTWDTAVVPFLVPDGAAQVHVTAQLAKVKGGAPAGDAAVGWAPLPANWEEAGSFTIYPVS